MTDGWWYQYPHQADGLLGFIFSQFSFISDESVWYFCGGLVFLRESPQTNVPVQKNGPGYLETPTCSHFEDLLIP